MPTGGRNYLKVILSTLLGGACSIAIGFLFYHYTVFQWRYPGFQFVMFGLCFAFLFSMLEARTKTHFAALVIIILLLTIVASKSFKITSIIRDATYVVLLSAAVLAIHGMINKVLRGIFMYRIAVWGILFTLGYIASAVVLHLIFKHELVLRGYPIYLKHGLLLSLGISCGIELSNLLTSKMQKG